MNKGKLIIVLATFLILFSTLLSAEKVRHPLSSGMTINTCSNCITQIYVRAKAKGSLACPVEVKGRSAFNHSVSFMAFVGTWSDWKALGSAGAHSMNISITTCDAGADFEVMYDN